MPKMSLAIMFSRSRGICEAGERSFKNTGAAGALSLRGFVGGYRAPHRPPDPGSRERRAALSSLEECKMEQRILAAA